MKISNKILVGFFGFIFIYLTAVFAEIRLSGTPNFIDDTNSIAETADISRIGYLVLQDVDLYIHVTPSDQTRLEVRSISGGLLQRINYQVVGDTLTLSQLDSDGLKTVRITVFVPRSGFKGMAVNGSLAIVEALHQEHLSVSQNEGRIWISDNNIGNVQVTASNRSFLEISATELDTLSVTLRESEVHVSSPVSLLQGSMENTSFLRAGKVDEIQFRKDETSRINLYEY